VIRAGVVVPHAPVLLPQLAGPETSEASKRIGAALRTIDLAARSVDLAVVLSPHGSVSGVYEDLRGSLAGFGAPGVAVERAADVAAAHALAERWGRPLISGDVDHGVLVPLLLHDFGGIATIAACLREFTDGDEEELHAVIEDGRAFASGLEGLAERRVALVASLNTSIALSPRAPLLQRPEARAADQRFLDALGRGASAVERVAVDLWRHGRSCASGPLAALARLLDARGKVLAYEAPVGVGYVVALFEGGP
jgi:hypothetical protein